MRLTLAWCIAHVPAVLAALFVSVRGGLKLPNFAHFGWDTLINYADRLFWISVTSSGFVVFDFVRRATKLEDRDDVLGASYAWHVSLSTLLMILSAMSFGMVLMADANAIVSRVQLPLVNGYAVVLVGGVLLSLAYALRIDADV